MAQATDDNSLRMLPQVGYARLHQAFDQDLKHGAKAPALAMQAQVRHAFLSQQTSLIAARTCAEAAASMGAQWALPNVSRVAHQMCCGLPGLDAPLILARSHALLTRSWQHPFTLASPRYRAARQVLASTNTASPPESVAEQLRMAAQALRTTRGHMALRVIDERGISPRHRLSRLKALARESGRASCRSERRALHRCIAQLGRVLNAAGAEAIEGVAVARQSLCRPTRAFNDADRLETMADRLVGSLFELYDNSAVRAFESHMMQQIVLHMPQRVCEAWQIFGVHMAQQWAALEPNLSNTIAQHIARRWGPSATRSWQSRAPRFVAWRAQSAALGAHAALHAYLQTPVDCGDELFGRLYVLRDLALMMGPLAGTSWGKESMAYWTDVLEPRAGRLRDFSTWDLVPKRTGSGITPVYLPPVSRVGDVPAVLTNTLVCTDLHHPPVANLVRRGHVLAGGLSGSTNLLIGMYQHACQTGLKALSEPDFILAVSAFMVYDGGHSLAEVMWPMQRRMGHKDAVVEDHEVVSYEAWVERVGAPGFVLEAQDAALALM